MPPMYPAFAIEGLYSCIIIIIALMIYLSTKEIYKLSLHKGLQYFRNAFLFFALAFFFRFMIIALISMFNLQRIFHIQPYFIGLFTLFVFIYASTMAMFYLLYSVMWKKLPKSYENVYALHLAALVISLVSTSTQHLLILLALQAAVFLFIAIESYDSYRKSRNKRGVFNLYVIYMMLFVFWILNILDILLPDFLRSVQLLIYTASVGLFLLILYKVVKAGK
jgi:hypothetical protein